MAGAPHVVIGASGILAPLGELLHQRGLRTVGISRGTRLSAGVWDVRVGLDTQDVDALASWAAAQPEPFAAVVAYVPAVAAQGWPILAALTDHLVVVATSEWVAPGAGPAPWAALPAVVVQLGWASTPQGSRWHTPAEVSQTVAAVLLDPAARRRFVLGSVRPWSGRPQ